MLQSTIEQSVGQGLESGRLCSIFYYFTTYVMSGELLKLVESHFTYKMGIILPSSKGIVKIKVYDDVIL